MEGTPYCNVLASRESVIVITTVILFCYFPDKIRYLFFTNKKTMMWAISVLVII